MRRYLIEEGGRNFNPAPLVLLSVGSCLLYRRRCRNACISLFKSVEFILIEFARLDFRAVSDGLAFFRLPVVIEVAVI